MKKKLSVLTITILLCVIPVANATPVSLVVGDGTTFTDPGDEVTIGIGDTIWVGVYDSIGIVYSANISNNISTFGEWSGNNAVYSPPVASDVPIWWYGTNGPGSAEYWYVDFDDPLATNTPLPGVGGAVEFRGLDVGDIRIRLNANIDGEDDIFTLHIIPEPATIFLFGLGAIILRRKSKK